nr:hypothetical protein Iba_chr07bCG11650 [Ipomoea batatas]
MVSLRLVPVIACNEISGLSKSATSCSCSNGPLCCPDGSGPLSPVANGDRLGGATATGALPAELAAGVVALCPGREGSARAGCATGRDRVEIDDLVLANSGGAEKGGLEVVVVDLDQTTPLIELHETTEGIAPEAGAETQVTPLLELRPGKFWFLHLEPIVPHLSHPSQVERRQTNVVAGGSALRPEELLTLVKPAGGIFSPVEPRKLQSGVLGGSGGCSRVGGGRPEHLSKLVLVGLHSFDRSLEILDCFGQRLVAHDDGL